MTCFHGTLGTSISELCMQMLKLVIITVLPGYWCLYYDI